MAQQRTLVLALVSIGLAVSFLGIPYMSESPPHPPGSIQKKSQYPLAPMVIDDQTAISQLRDVRKGFTDGLLALWAASHHNEPGLWDFEFIATHLAAWREREQYRSLDGQTVQDVFIDVGANVGRTSDRMMALFSPVLCYTHSDLAGFGQDCRGVQEWFIAFEPAPGNFRKLLDRSEQMKWDRGNWCGVNAAVSGENGAMPFHYEENRPTHASLDASGGSLQVPVVRLDDFVLGGDGPGFKNITTAGPIEKFWQALVKTDALGVSGQGEKPRTARIYLMKIDAEGFDPLVARGAIRLLTAHTVKFVILEYNALWFQNGRTTTLKEVADWMFTLDYLCFWLAPKNLVPLWQGWWDDRYEIKHWSNFICIDGRDESAKGFVNSYNDLKVPF